MPFESMKLPRLPLNFDLVQKSFERARKFALIKMSELKRGLEDADPTVPVTVEASATGEPPAKKQRIKNRKFALLLCYDGQNYFGLQR